MPTAHENLIARLGEMAEQYRRIEADLADPAVFGDPRKVRTLGARRSALAGLVERYERWRAIQDEMAGHEQLISEAAGEDAELAALARSELPGLRERADALLDEIASELVTADDLAVGSVILELRAAAGGAEAGLWAGDLLQMYQRFAASRKWSVDTMELAGGEQGGVRHAVLQVSGNGVWQGLGYEGGVHCVKRVPATESQGRVHTSTATVAVLPEPEQVELAIDESEVDEHVTTSQGPGGQNVNKVATAVHLIHRPTGIEVRMQESKSQHQNRARAWQLLRARLYEFEKSKRDAERAESRAAMIGSGGRSERIRTYRYKDSIAVDHRLNRSFPLQAVLNGELDELIDALVAEDRAKRLAAL